MSIQIVLTTIRKELADVKRSLRPWFAEGKDCLAYRPADGGWSALQILEHIMLTSHFLLLLIDKASLKAVQRAQRMDVKADWTKYVLAPAALDAIGIHKSFSWIRPRHMEPSGNVSVAEIRERIDDQFTHCDELLRKLSNGEGTLCHITMTVNDIGKLDVYQYIYFLALHARRHLKQLEENKIEFARTAIQ